MTRRQVLVDLIATQDPDHPERGIPTYVRELAVALEAVDSTAVSTFLIDSAGPFPRSLAPLLSSGKLSSVKSVHAPESVLHLTSPFAENLDPIALAGAHRGPLVVTMYDLIPLRFAEHYLDRIISRPWYLSRLELVRSADRVLCISESTAADTISLLDINPDRVQVVGTGIPRRFRPSADRGEASSFALAHVPGLRPNYMLFTGGIDHRKNLDGMLAAFSLIPADQRSHHQLVIVCRMTEDQRHHIMQLAEQYGVASDILLTGYLSDDHLLKLYQAAYLFVFPAIYEGFGLPAAEAMACGVPTIAGDNSSLREIVLDPRARFNASDPRDMARVMTNALGNNEFRRELVAAAEKSSFSWSDVAKQTIRAYNDLIELPASRRRPSTAKSKRSQVAILSPMPPAPSGISDYTERLVREFQRTSDVTIFAQADADRSRLPGAEWSSYYAFPVLDRLRAFDHVIFCIGNSYLHVEILDVLLRAGRGTALVHDVYLHGLYSIATDVRPSLLSTYARETLRSSNTQEMPIDHQRFAAHAVGYFDLNRPLIRDIASSVDRVLVHSRAAASLAAIEVATGDRHKISRVPFGHQLSSARSVVAKRDAVISAGIAHSIKQSPKVIDAFIALAAKYPQLTFAIVGPIQLHDDTQAEIHAKIEDSGFRDRIVLTGRIDDARYTEWLDRALIGVQLRDLSRGENSAAISDCFSSGAGVVASNVGSVPELGGAVCLVDRDVTWQELAEVISGLLDDPRQLAALARSGAEYAAANTFEQSARAIVAAGARSPR